MKTESENNLDNKFLEVLRNEPNLKGEQELHKKIMLEVDRTDQQSITSIQKHVLRKIVRRSLKAAAVLLILIFGYEQYMVTSSLLELENKISTSAPESNIDLRTKIMFNLGSINSYSDLSKAELYTKKSEPGNRIKIARISAFIQVNIPRNQIKSISKNIEL